MPHGMRPTSNDASRDGLGVEMDQQFRSDDSASSLVRAPEFLKTLADTAASARNTSGGWSAFGFDVRSARAERSGVEGHSTPPALSLSKSRGDRHPKLRSNVFTSSGALSALALMAVFPRSCWHWPRCTSRIQASEAKLGP
jgi:hypothetical protein